MTKKLIYLSISFISIALICVIFFQVLWYNNALQLKKELYEKSVQEALQEVVTQIENREAMNVITDNLEFYTTVPEPPVPATNNLSYPLPSPPNLERTALIHQARQSDWPNAVNQAITGNDVVFDTLMEEPFGYPNFGNNPINLDPIKYRIKQQNDSLKIYNLKDVAYISLDSAITLEEKQIAVKTGQKNAGRHQNSLTIALEQLNKLNWTSNNKQEIDSITRAATFWVKEEETQAKKAYVEAKKEHMKALAVLESQMIRLSDTLSNRAFTNKIVVKIGQPRQKITQAEVTRVNKQPEKIKDNITTNEQGPNLVKLRLSRILNKLAQEMESKEQSQMERISMDTLQRMIATALGHNGIEDTFLFDVKARPNLFTSIDSITAKAYHIALFPHDILHKTAQLQLFIPGKDKQLSQSMFPHLLSSMLFTCMIILTFAYSIYVMLKQKKMADVKNDFINNMTHEFKTPIATISLATDTITNIQTIHDAERIRHYTKVIKEENQRMNTQVEKVLQLAITDKNTFDLSRNMISLHQMIQQILEKFRLILEAENRKVFLQLYALNDELYADEFHLSNAITNIVDNAIKYSKPQSAITITTSQLGEGLTLQIQDEGIGMKKEVQKRAFEKFYRAQHGNLHDVKGFGIGLSYVKNVVEAHKGTIVLQSTPGKGTTISITLNKGMA